MSSSNTAQHAFIWSRCELLIVPIHSDLQHRAVSFCRLGNYQHGFTCHMVGARPTFFGTEIRRVLTPEVPVLSLCRPCHACSGGRMPGRAVTIPARSAHPGGHGVVCRCVSFQRPSKAADKPENGKDPKKARHGIFCGRQLMVHPPWHGSNFCHKL